MDLKINSMYNIHTLKTLPLNSASHPTDLNEFNILKSHVPSARRAHTKSYKH